MDKPKDNYQLLIEKLDRFIRKYYVNNLIKGSLYFVGLVLLLFLTVSLLEYNYYFSGSTRKILFFSFLGTSILALFGWVILPLSQYFKLGKVISNEQAAVIIGKHFGNVQDKLLNILQLNQQSSGSENEALIRASVNQKTEELKPVPFRNAINLGQNKKYLRFALPPLLLLCLLLFIDANIIKDSTNRLINNNQEFERPAPFTFKVANNDLSVVQYDDFKLNVEVEGAVMPSEVFINVDNYRYNLKETAPGKYSYTFSKVQKETNFRFEANGFNSKKYDLDVLKKPNIVGFDVAIDYPSYTGRRDERIANVGDLVLPSGSKIDWVFTAENTEAIAMNFSGKNIITKRNGTQQFIHSKKATKNELYTIYVSNEHLPNADSVAYTITIIPDLYPSISVEQFRDSSDNKMIYFVGDASDDYGIRKVNFNYKLEREGKITESVVPMLNNPGKSAPYEHTWDLQDIEMQPGDKLSYFFEVFDNDGVQGSKSSRTSLMNFEMPTVEEFQNMAEKNNESIKNEMSSAMEDAKKLQDELKKLQDKMAQKEKLDWQDKKDLEKLKEKHEHVKEKMEQAKEQFDMNIQNESEFKKPNEEIQQKQEKLQEMFDELLNEEMKEMIEQMEKMMEEMNRDKAMEDMEDMEMNDEELEKELDRMLELFKQLELEQKMEEQIDKLEELAKKQEELSEESKKEDSKPEDIKKKQDELNEEFEKAQEKMDDILKKNEELETPMDMEDPEKMEEEIKEEMEKSSEKLGEKKKKEASDSQKDAAEKMKKMAEKMSSMMQSAQMEQMEEDMESLRQLLENLVNLSFDEEALMNKVQKANPRTPYYVSLVQDQYKLKDDFAHIEDSLQALAKRLFQIESFVLEKVGDINKNFKTNLTELEAREKRQKVVSRQQYIMTNVNDLALMLSEVMDQLQQQMASEMEGSQMCQNPGNKKGNKPGKKPMQGMGDLQKQLNKQMKDMQEGLKKGEMPGKGQGGMSKQFAEMAAKQSALRKALRDMQKEQQSKGQGAGNGELDKLIEQMNETETDLVNKKLTEQMIKRQEEILTRLLETEEAMKEREFDKKRQSETAQKKERKIPPSLEEYLKKREAEIDMYRAVSPNLRPYYKTLVEEYFNELKTK